jgi:hypothetical protein
LILEELRAAQDDIRQRQGELTGQINIGMGASVARSLMPAVISRFMRSILRSRCGLWKVSWYQ